MIREKDDLSLHSSFLHGRIISSPACDMHISALGAAVSLLGVSVAAFTPASTFGTDKLSDHGMTKLMHYLDKNNECSLSNAVKRQEWYV